MATYKKKGKGKKTRYVVRYDGERDPVTKERKQLQKTFRTEKEAKEFVSVLTLNKSTTFFPTGMLVKKEPIAVSFQAYAIQWFEGKFYTRVRSNTFKNRRYYLEKHILPFFGDKNLSSITPSDIDNFYAHLKRNGYADKTISTIHKFLNSLFRSAAINGDLTESPMEKLEKKPKDPVRIAEPWTLKESSQFIEAAERAGKDVLYDFDLDTGLRQGEALALPWFNVDLEQKTVTVTRSVSYDEDGNPELLPKTPESYRTLSLSDTIIEKLQNHKRRQDQLKKRFGPNYNYELDLVFPTSRGDFLNPSNVRREFYALIKKAGVRRIRFHDLRHTHSAMLIRTGSSPGTVQERLGHEDIETTFKYYGHLWRNADREAVDKLEKERNKYKSPKNVQINS
jgi:integrase